MSTQRVGMGWRGVLISGIAAVQLAGCGVVGIASPEGKASLRLEGTVKDAGTGSPIGNAKVSLVMFVSGWPELQSVRTGSDGRYVLTYEVMHVVTDEEFENGCDVWENDETTSLGIQVSANGYSMWASDGVDGTPLLRCIDAPQTLDFRLHK